MVKTLIKKLGMGLAILIILAAVCSSLFRSLTPWAKQYKAEVEQHFTQLLGKPVTIQNMETGWYWFFPVLKLEQFTLNKGKKNSIHLDKLLVGIDLFKSLWGFKIQPGILSIENLHLVVREKKGGWDIEGLSATPVPGPAEDLEKKLQMLLWLTQQEKLIIKDLSLEFHASDGRYFSISDLNLRAVNQGGHYKIDGKARFDQGKAAFFQFMGDLYFDPYQLQQSKGRVYFLAKQSALDNWQSLFSKDPSGSFVGIRGGTGDIALWVDWDKGGFSSLQAELQLQDFSLNLQGKSTQKIQTFHANCFWKPDEKGWKLHADKIQLTLGGVSWPENQMLLGFDKVQQSYQIFVKSILIESLLSQKIDSPWPIQRLLSIHPQGLLSDTQLVLKEEIPELEVHPPELLPQSEPSERLSDCSLCRTLGILPFVIGSDLKNKPRDAEMMQNLASKWKLTYLLTRFDQLRWQALGSIPQVRSLSGVLHWQPEEGRLDLDSKQVLLAFKGYPAQNFSLFNGSVEWKELSDGLRVSIDRLVLSQPELTLSLQGALDQVKPHSLGNIRLVTEFSAKNLQQWFPFLPKAYLKPKFYDWLTKQKAGEASGKILVNGLASDFPFDNKNGEFSIRSHLSKGELLIQAGWPRVKEIESTINLDHRNLLIAINHADFQGVPVKEMNLRIDDIGKDKENLLIHGRVQGSAQKMRNYILASPLKEKLNQLKMLSMKGLLFLDLRLEIPLYPENDENLLRGLLVFKDNTLVVKHRLKEFALEEVTGDLSFDEHGVTHSALQASAWGYPLTIKVASVKSPKPVTNLLIDWECTVESIKNHFKSSVLSLLKGRFFINAILSLPENPHDPMSINLKSSLHGLAIHLPEPLGKKQEESLPLEVTLDLKSQKAWRLQAHYANKLSADLLLNQDMELQSGLLLLGKGQAVNSDKPGLAVMGVLDGFNLQEWKQVMEDFSTKNNQTALLNKLRIIRVKLKRLTFLNQEFDQMVMKASLLPNQDWSLQLDQKNLAADLNYTPSSNLLSGLVKRLHLAPLDKTEDNKGEGDRDSLRHPGQIPNLNLRLDQVSFGQVKLGDITLKSHSSEEKWSIDYCKIDSPAYSVLVGGAWTQKGKKNGTTLSLKLHINNLAQSLERWGVHPAVDAGKGDLEFQGDWQGALWDFSLSTLSGNLYLELKNGRITHLSPETEEKLGLGKLLSILSLQTIPRRLQLDFSDLSHQGYSFDVFKGNFVVNKGMMSTQDSTMDGPVAYASMKGDLDLLQRTYNLNLSISPHITASLPLVATIAGGPIAGVAAWVASKIINQGMQKISNYTYQISGPWQEPIVQQLTLEKQPAQNTLPPAR